MSVKGFDKIRQSEELSAGAAFLLWLVLGVGLVLLVDKVIPSILTLMLAFGFIYPAGCFVMFFSLCKRHGVMWYFPVAVITSTVLMYALWETYRAIIPNLIVMTVLCLLFGCGLGGCFADKEAVRAYREQRRMRKLGEDKPYTSIINDSDVRKNKK